MKTIKPGALSLLTRTIEHRGRCIFVVSPLLFVSLTGEVRLKSEVALWKFAAAQLGKDAAIDAGQPKAVPEFLVHAQAFAPGGKPCPACAVRARVAGREKTLFAFGDRYWEGRTASEPVPFTRMPIDWSRAYGGPGFALNPAGRGADPGAEAPIPLPNIEYPDARLTRPDQPGRPAGFGPREVTHPERAALAGTYDDAWLKTDFPGLARDLDWKHFNVAPPDQWLEGTLTGSEEWEFENLHPDQRLLRGRLPGFATRCFVRHATPDGERFGEIATRLDTIWFFPEQECAILVGRGVMEVAEDDAADISLLVAAVEWADARRGEDHYAEAVRRRLDPETGHYYLLQEDDLLPEGIGQRYGVERLAGGPVESPTLLSENLRKRQAAEIEEARAKVAEHGLDPDEGHAPPPLEPVAAPPQKLEELPAYLAGMQRRGEAMKAEFEAREAQLETDRRAASESAGIDYAVIEAEMNEKPKGPPKFSASAELASLRRLRSAMKAEQGSAEEIDLYLEDPAFRQRLTDAERQGRESYQRTAHRQTAADPMDPDRAAWVRQWALERFRSGASFAGIDLTGADLSGLDLRGADFSGAFLEGANLSGCRLEGADFSQSVLARANLTDALLVGARLPGANLGGALCTRTRFDEARLDGAILSGARLERSCFVRASLTRADLGGGALFGETDWSDADAQDLNFIDVSLEGLILRGAHLERGVFVRCRFEGVDFSGARLARAVFVKPQGAGARFRGAHFAGAVFVGGSALQGADFSGASIVTTLFRPADLTGARFDRATLKEADLSECRLQGASFVMATATDSRFMKADLAQARFTSANLMNSSLQKAHLEGADFRHANLYGVDLARVWVDGATDFTRALTHRARTWPRRPRATSGGGAS